MRRPSFLIAVICAMLQCLSISCNRHENTSSDEIPRIRVQGTVYAWRCGIGDIWNNPRGGDMRFASQTGEKAKISFLRLSGLGFAGFTDDSSRYDWYLDEGAYVIILETGYFWPPDTFSNVYLGRDTVIDMNFIFDYLDADSMTISFYYDNKADSLPVDSEWYYIRVLNGRLHGNLQISGFTPPLGLRVVQYGLFWPSSYVTYEVAIRRDRVHMGQIWEQAYSILKAEGSIFPAVMSADPSGIYGCWLGKIKD